MQRQQKRRNNPARVFARGAFLLFILASASVAHASQTSGTIDSVHKYAWGNVAGYVNFAPTNGGLTITDSAITGYAWGANTGWINFNASQSHVTNNGNGTLGGFAWDSGGGWVSFTGVTIDTSGKFHGTATGVSYSISFDCTNCDVRTDWRPASARTSSSSGSGGGCAPGFVWNPATISCVPVASYSPVITPLPSSASSTVTTVTKVSSPFQPTSNTFGKNNPGTKNITPTTTAFKNTVSTTSAIHTATTTAKQTVASSFFNFIHSVWWIVLAAILILALFFFLAKF